MSQHQTRTGPITVNDAAPFTSSMTAGYQPDRGVKSRLDWHRGWFSREPDIPLGTIESVLCSRPESPRLFRRQRGPSFFPWSGTPAPFSPEMVTGSRPDRNRQTAPHIGWFSLPIADVFAFEMMIGWQPDRPRTFSGPRTVGWSASVPTFTVAPFSVEMSAGQKPERGRFFRAREPHLGNVVQIDIFDIAATYGWKPSAPRLFSTRTHTGWSVSQTTHVAAPITVDMLQGSQPAKNRAWLPLRTGLFVLDNTIIIPFTAVARRWRQWRAGSRGPFKSGVDKPAGEK